MHEIHERLVQKITIAFEGVCAISRREKVNKRQAAYLVSAAGMGVNF